MAQHRRILGISAACVLSMLLPSLSRAGTWVAFQNSYTRGTGSPVTVTSTFTLLNPNTQYTLKAFNGGLENDTTELVSYSVVYLNGAQVVGPSNFNQNVAEVNVTIFPGLTNTLSVQVRGKPGGVLTIQVIGVDNDPPTITASVSPAPNAAGWNNSPVTVTFTCSDKTSGIASCPSPVTVGTEGANQVVSGTATDLAGNTASTSVTINLDMTPPTITASINPPPDAGGYNSGPVTVMFNCADALSGVASCSPAVSVSEEGSFPETGMAVDVAGNTASTTITVNISLSYFKIRSWQTGPNGNAQSPSGKCLDYGASPSGNGASVFLNDCASAHPVRVVEVSVCVQDPNNPTGPPICGPRSGSGGISLSHEVMLFAGNEVIGIHNPITITTGGTPGPPPSATEYQLELQIPFGAKGGNISSPANQIFRLDGDSIILEGSSIDPASKALVPGPCINTDSTPQCPASPSQLVIQVQNARGTNGSPLVAAVRNLSDNEFWDFVPASGSRPYPTMGFTSVASPDALWNAICTNQTTTTTSGDLTLVVPPASACAPFTSLWGSVILISSPSDCAAVPGPFKGQTQDIGGCLDLSPYMPLTIPAGVTLRGSRRGTLFGSQLYFSFASWQAYSQPLGLSRQGNCNPDACMIEVRGDYVRFTGMRLRGESRAMDTSAAKTIAIQVDYPGNAAPLFNLTPNLATSTQFIATIDHNDGSEWGESPVEGQPIFTYGIPDSTGNKNNHCSYVGFADSQGNNWYQCDQYGQLVPYPGTNPFSSTGVGIFNDPGTYANIRIARNFLHHNERDDGGYGASVRGRALIERNTFSWNRHDISADAEPHNEFHAFHNLVLSGAPVYSNPLIGRLQDFDMHGTDNSKFCYVTGCTSLWVGGVGGYFVEVAGNTFLGGDGHDYVLRGYPVNWPSPINYSQYYGNVSRRKENDAVHFIHCVAVDCVNDFNSNATDFPIVISNSVFGQMSASPPDPMSTLGVGDFDGDGDDDLFAATGNTWFYSPAGQREWRYLNSATDTIDQLLFGDFDGDGRTDVVGMRNGQLVISWGGISAFEVLNSNALPCVSMSDMAVGDFDGDGHPDIFCADGQTWWISYGGNTPFVQVIVSDLTRRNDLRFGDFDGDGTTDVFGVVNGGLFTTPHWQVRYGIKGLRGALGPWRALPVSLTTNSASVDGLVVADFDGDANGIADIGMSCNGGAGWQISYAGAQGWSSCNNFASPSLGNLSICGSSPCITLADGAVGRFSGGSGADILLWYYTNSQGAAPLLDIPGGTGAARLLSSQDMH